MTTQVKHAGQHLYKHKSQEVKYNDPAKPSINNVKKAIDDLYTIASGMFTWKDAVATRNDLPVTGNVINDARIVEDDGDSKPAIYICVAITGGIMDQWKKIADVDWGGVVIFNNITEAKATGGTEREMAFIVDERSFYQYVVSGIAYTPDDKFILTTLDGGNTRWVSSGGRNNLSHILIKGELDAYNRVIVDDIADAVASYQLYVGADKKGEWLFNRNSGTNIFRNLHADGDIEFWGNDGGVDTMIAKLDVSEGQLTGLIKATTGVFGTAVAGTDYEVPLIFSTGLTRTTNTITTNDSEINHNSLSNYDANRHFLQGDITAITGALTTGLLKVTTTTGLLETATAGTDYYNPGGTDVAVADGGTGVSVFAVGDIVHATGTTTLAGLAGVAAGQPLLSGGVGTVSAYAGYTFSGTAAQTYTLPGATATLASLAGAETLSAKTLTTIKSVSFAIHDAGDSGVAKTIDWADGSVQKVTMTANCTFTFTNPVVGSIYKLYLIQDITGIRTHTWTGGGLDIKWNADVEPVWATSANAVNIALFDYDGTYRGDGFVEGAVGISHNDLDDLTVGDVHDQYVLLAGRSGGQTIYGGTGASNDLELYSTSNGTKGNILLKDDTKLDDDVKLLLGTGEDGEIYVNADDLHISNITADKDIIFSGNDGGVQTEIMRLDASAGQLTGLIKATTGVLETAVAGTDYVTPTGTETLTNKNIQRTINAQTGTTYTFVLTDAGKVVTFTHADPQTITVPKNSSVAFPINTQIDCMGLGAGKVTFAPVDGDVTIRSKDGNLAIGAQYVGATLLKIATDEWVLLGDLIA